MKESNRDKGCRIERDIISFMNLDMFDGYNYDASKYVDGITYLYEIKSFEICIDDKHSGAIKINMETHYLNFKQNCNVSYYVLVGTDNGEIMFIILMSWGDMTKFIESNKFKPHLNRMNNVNIIEFSWRKLIK